MRAVLTVRLGKRRNRINILLTEVPSVLANCAVHQGRAFLGERSCTSHMRAVLMVRTPQSTSLRDPPTHFLNPRFSCDSSSMRIHRRLSTAESQAISVHVGFWLGRVEICRRCTRTQIKPGHDMAGRKSRRGWTVQYQGPGQGALHDGTAVPYGDRPLCLLCCNGISGCHVYFIFFLHH